MAVSLLGAAATAQDSTAAKSESNSAAASSEKTAPATPRKIDRAGSYYHYSLAHYYEEMVTAYGRSDMANKAIEEYRLAIQADPSAEFLTPVWPSST